MEKIDRLEDVTAELSDLNNDLETSVADLSDTVTSYAGKKEFCQTRRK